MNPRKKFLSLFATAGILFGMTGGMAAAQVPGLVGTDDTVLGVTCAETATVEVDVLEDFSVDVSTHDGYVGDTITDAFVVTLDLSCNWSTNFSVDATIGSFDFQGTAPGYAHQTIPGSVLTLHDGSITREGPDALFADGPAWWWPFPVIFTGDPDISLEVFPGPTDVNPNMIQDGTLIPYFLEQASPGISTAVWSGTVSDLPPNLAEGDYVAPLTVTLTVG